MDTRNLSYQVLDEVMEMSKDVRKKYSEALTLIINTGTKPEDAFQETGFMEAYEKERGRHGKEGEENTDNRGGAY